MKKLTERQKRFVDSYIQCGNASEAYRQAGYSSKNADVDSSKLMVNPSIAAEIKQRLKELENSRTATIQDALEYISDVLLGNTTEKNVLVVGNGRNAHIETVETPPKIKDRLRAAEMILKFNQKGESEPVTEIRIIRAGKQSTE